MNLPSFALKLLSHYSELGISRRKKKICICKRTENWMDFGRFGRPSDHVVKWECNLYNSAGLQIHKINCSLEYRIKRLILAKSPWPQRGNKLDNHTERCFLAWITRSLSRPTTNRQLIGEPWFPHFDLSQGLSAFPPPLNHLQ